MSAPESEQTIGRYRILRPLGMGAMGKVYLAEDPRIERLLAIKTVRVEGREGEVEERKRRLLREAKAAGRLIHPHVVTLFDAGEDGDTLFLAFEYVKGSDLSGRLEQGPPFTLAEALRVVRQAADGLAYAHQQGIVHRDIKPSNILLDERSWVKVSDFGIAKMAGQATELTMTGSVVGSPHYLSPEQIRGEDLDGRSDLFSLGVVLYELLSRKRPFEAETLTSLIYQILNQEPPAMIAGEGEIAGRLNEIVRKLMAKERDERYAQAADVVADIAALERNLPANVLSVPAATFLGPVATAPITRAGAGMPPLPPAPAKPATVVPLPPLPGTPLPGTPGSGAPAVLGGGVPGGGAPVSMPLAPLGPPAEKKKSPLLLVGIVLAALAVLLVAGGLFVFSKLRSGSTPATQTADSGPTSPETTNPDTRNPAANPLPGQSPSTATPSKPAPGTTRPAGVRIIEGPGSEQEQQARANEPALRPAPPVQAPPTSVPTAVPPTSVPTAPRPAADEPKSEPSRPAADDEETTEEPSRPSPSADRTLDTGMNIRLQVEPADAFVLINGRMRGVASELKNGFTLPDPGDNLLVVRKEGMKDARILLRASTSLGTTPVQVRLQMLSGASASSSDLAVVRVAEGVGFKDINPKNVSVQVDGKDQGPASQYSGLGRWLKLAPGRHRISLVAPGFQRIDYIVEVAAGNDEDHERIPARLPPGEG